MVAVSKLDADLSPKLARIRIYFATLKAVASRKNNQIFSPSCSWSPNMMLSESRSARQIIDMKAVVSGV